MPNLYRKHARGKTAGRFSLGILFCLLCFSCPLNLPEQVRLKASPSLYMPVGNPMGTELGELTSGLGQLTSLDIGSNDTNTLIYDYQGPEYDDTRVIMVAMEVASVDIGGTGTPKTVNTMVAEAIALAEAAEKAGLPFPPVSLPLPIPQGTNDGIDLSSLLGSGGVLKDYLGLEFRSVPAYLYINGPARIFQGGNVLITLEFKDGSNTPQGSPYKGTVVPTAFPSLPATPGAVVKSLSPKSGVSFELKDVFNGQSVGLKVEMGFAIGDITLNNLNELRAFARDLQIPLTAHLILLLPFQFTVNKTKAPNGIPVFAGPSANPIGTEPAMALIEGGGDLLGRDTGGGDGTMDDIMENLQSLSLEVSIVNNLGINGSIKMLKEMPTTTNPDPGEVGKINLSGKSAITINKSDLEPPPFSPALEIYLDGDFDIKRSLPPEGAMTMDMAVILRTNIDMTF
jgi:hypothetical protein